jgi:tRNA dimethylallyltransferase
LEIMALTNKPLSALVEGHGFQDFAFQALKICLQIDREELYHRINKRSLLMVETGLIEETRNLLAKGYSRDLKPMKSLGYRQLTWFRADPSVIWIDPQRKERLVETIALFAHEP